MSRLAANDASPLRSFLRKLGYIIFSALIIVAFHAMVLLLLYLFFGDKALEPSEKIYNQSDDDEQIVMSAPTDAEFNEWVRIAEPRQWLLPDYQDGFSAQYATSSRHYVYGKDAQYEIKRSAIDNSPVAPRPLSWQLPPRSDALQQAWDAYTITPSHNTKRDATKRIAHQVYWRNAASGNILNPAPELSAQALARWATLESSNLRRAHTQIELSQPTGMALPRIIIRQSCGDEHLDAAAAAALRAFMLRHPPRRAISSTPNLFEVDWDY